MSFLALPTELLQAILEEAASMTTSSISYQQRQKILTTCCLVSRSFLNIARPLLCSILYTASQDELDRFLEEARLSGVGGYVKVAHFVYEPGDSSSVRSLGRIAARLPALQDLRLSHGHIVLEELINLQALKQLRSLALECYFLDSLCSGKLESLEDLTMGMTGTGNLGNLLNRRRLPSLQAVALLAYNDFDIAGHFEGLPPLVWDLRTVVIDVMVAERLCRRDVVHLKSAALVAPDGRLVIAHSTSRVGQLGLLSSPSGQGRRRDPLTLSNIASFLRNPNLPLTTVIFPSRLRDNPHMPRNDKIHYNSALALCKAKRIEILYEEGWGSELMVPKVLIEKVRSKDQVGET